MSVAFQNTTYYYSGGVYYAKQGANFIVVNTPIGITVNQLPPGANQVVVNNEVYYLASGGIYYKPAMMGSGTVYTTVKL